MVIGRNEGERLTNCLAAIPERGQLVYADSGSEDGSVARALAMGAQVLMLDSTMPFTAARARNEGFRHLVGVAPDITYVQFIDADCELVSGWLEKAVSFLGAHREVAVASGRLRERYPEQSIYNRLCDTEWDTPVGEAKACGGIALIRRTAFEEVGGYRADLVAGEEPEMCVRLRAAGWKIWRLDEEMALHEAGITTFAQWWKRATRAGYAFAQGASLHGARPEKFWVRESRRAWIWALGVPLCAAILTLLFGAIGLSVLALYPFQIARLALGGNRSMGENFRQAIFLLIGKFPEVQGQIKFMADRWLSRHARLIEYK